MNLVNVYNDFDGGWTVEPDIEGFLYWLLSERDTRESISHSRLPAYADHERFVRSRPFRGWYVIDEGEWIGAVSVNSLNEIRIHFLPGKRTWERVKEALAAVKEKHPPLEPKPSVRAGYVLNVSPRDMDMHAALSSIGARVVQNTYAL